MVLKRSQFQVVSSGKSNSFLEPCKTMQQLPSLWSFLTQAEWEDGSSRQTGTLTLMVQDGMAKICVNDRDSESSCFVSGSSFTTLFKVVDTALAEGKLEFRLNPWARRKPRGKRP